jgi:hypothetical protein
MSGQTTISVRYSRPLLVSAAIQCAVLLMTAWQPCTFSSHTYILAFVIYWASVVALALQYRHSPPRIVLAYVSVGFIALYCIVSVLL